VIAPRRHHLIDQLWFVASECGEGPQTLVVFSDRSGRAHQRGASEQDVLLPAHVILDQRPQEQEPIFNLRGVRFDHVLQRSADFLVTAGNV
jgi:hypothetical protein